MYHKIDLDIRVQKLFKESEVCARVCVCGILREGKKIQGGE